MQGTIDSQKKQNAALGQQIATLQDQLAAQQERTSLLDVLATMPGLQALIDRYIPGEDAARLKLLFARSNN